MQSEHFFRASTSLLRNAIGNISEILLLTKLIISLARYYTSGFVEYRRLSKKSMI
jgi:hypothetical protein